MKEIILYISCAISTFIIAIYEISYISNYSNINLILTNEIEGYNFTYICSIVNILNTIFLLWFLFDKNNIKIINCVIIINLIIGLWNISLYYNLKIIGRFNKIIILEFYVFLIKCLLFSILSFINYFYKLNKNYIILAEPLIQNDLIST